MFRLTITPLLRILKKEAILNGSICCYKSVTAVQVIDVANGPGASVLIMIVCNLTHKIVHS